MSLPTVLRALTKLEDYGIIKEVTGKERHKVFVYSKYLNILNEGTEPLKL
jgi:Fe2+ or Zn2+ uptake regulation protein